MFEPDHRWQEIRFTVEYEAADAVEFALNSLGASGTAIDMMPSSGNNFCVIGYFTKLPDDETIQDELHYALSSFGLDENTIVSVDRSEIGNTDWLAEWKKHWKPTTIGSFVIAAPWHDVDESDKIVIRIEPNMAFGTGTHETTQLCLQAIDELYRPGDSFLDVGTGTGILAIAAALAGRTPSDSDGALLGVDTDSDAIAIAKENAKMNGVGNKIDFHVGPIDGNFRTYDFVCANLTLDVILPILPALLERSKKHLVLSGILAEQEPQIVEALSNHVFHSRDVHRAGEWICLVIKK